MDIERLIRRGRYWLLLLIIAAAGVTWRLAQFEGLARPIRVSGPSMSPTLWGPSQRVACGQCGLSHRIHASPAAAQRTLRCFGCGQLGVQVSDCIAPGDRVLIDRAAYFGSSPRREDLVAIRMPAGGLQVKRVVGLPGEVLRIDRDGGLVIEGEPHRISPEQSWQRSILVYDDRHPGPTGSRWRRSPEDWWIYHHVDIHSARGEPERGEAAPVRDDDPANASLSRQTRPVLDFQLALRLRSNEACTLELVFASTNRPIPASIPLAAGDQIIRVSKIGDAVWQLTGDGPPRRVDRGELAASAASRPEVDSCRPVAIRLRGGGPVQIERLWLGRSVRFDPPRASADRWWEGITVAADRYIVIGDNPPASDDSRSAPEGIPRDRIVGRVIPWPW